MQRFKDILAIKTPEGRFVGFHARNLEVAELSSEAWDVLGNPTDSDEALIEMKEWASEETQSFPEIRSDKFNSLTLNVTQICNLHCVYCAAGGDGTFGDPVKKISVEKTLPQMKFFIQKLSQGDDFHLTFLGGEPLIYPEAITLVADYVMAECEAKGITPHFNVVTNGTLFNAKTLPVLSKIKASLTISLDGDKEVNDKTRPNKAGKGVTDQVVAGLGELMKIRSSLGQIGFSGVFGAQNLEMESAYAFYSQFQPDWLDFVFDHHNADMDISQKFIDGFSALCEKIYATEGEQGLRKIKFMDNYFSVLESQRRVENFCGAGKSFLMVDARNNVYTCPWVVGDKEEMVGHGESLWANKLEAYQKPLVDKPSCQDCWAKFVCGGGCSYVHKTSTGSKNKVDLSFCFRTRSLIALAIMYYERSRNNKELAVC